MIIRFEHFHDSLNVVFMLAPGCEFPSAKRNEIKLTMFFLGNCYYSFLR